MVLGNFEPKRGELHHAALPDLHESAIFRGEHQRWRMAEVYKSEKPIRSYLAVQHGCEFPRTAFQVSAQGVPSSNRPRKPEVNSLEHLRRCSPIAIQLREHGRMKSVMHGRRNFCRNDSVSLRIYQQDSCCGEIGRASCRERVKI